jgi:hypothetical protein
MAVQYSGGGAPGIAGERKGAAVSNPYDSQQALINQRQTAAQAASRALQQQQYADQEAERGRIAQQRASQEEGQLLLDPNNYRTTNGMEMQVSNGGGGSASGSASGSRGGGGVQIGGSIYPNISDMASQIQAASRQTVAPPPRIAPPQVPLGTDGFAHAKDVSGRTGNKAVEALRNSMTHDVGTCRHHQPDQPRVW